MDEVTKTGGGADETDRTGQDPGVVPDGKDWTWVLERPCPECGFDSARLEVAAMPALIQENAAAWQVRLAATSGLPVGQRPSPGVWSPLEYACHVRDVNRLFAERVRLMLDQVDPAFANWNQDETAVAGNYLRQDPARVAQELVEAAGACAQVYAGLPDTALGRRGFRSDGSVFTVETIARYHAHDLVHHAWDCALG